MLRLRNVTSALRSQSWSFTYGYATRADSSSKPKEESARMKRFHEQLKLEKMPRPGPAMRFVDLVLVETDPNTGELIPNNDKNPTKWGDWQHNGRVTDF